MHAKDNMKESKDKRSKESHKKHSEKDERIGELTDMLQRVQAEFENFKKRNERESQNLLKYSTAGLIRKLLPVLDSFQECMKTEENKGIKEIYNQFMGILREEGLKRLEVKGEQFDPYKHEALQVEQTQNEQEDQVVTEEFQAGYALKDDIIRHAKVKIKKYAADLPKKGESDAGASTKNNKKTKQEEE